MSRDSYADAEIERLLAGSPPAGEPEPLAGLFAVLRSDGAEDVDDTTVARLVSMAAAAAGTAETPPARPKLRSSLSTFRRRAAAFAVAVTALVGGTSGLALAADGAKPGDVLYGVDRALESVGIGAGGAHERLGEADALINAGEIQRGLDHVADLLGGNDGNVGAAQALSDASDRLADRDASDATRQEVAALLDYLAENIDDLDGSQVAQLAHEIGNGDHPTTPAPSGDTPGPPEDVPADPPGLEDKEPGPPEGVNPPGLEDKEPGPPEGVNPPGLEDKEPGPPEGVNPPGLDARKPGPPDRAHR